MNRFALVWMGLTVAACTPKSDSTDKASSGSATTPSPSNASAPATRSTATGAPASTSTIACGATTCKAGSEVCCDATSKHTQSCKPLGGDTSENGLLNACGSHKAIIAMMCDDSGDCPGDQICCMPIRHGTDVDYATEECLPLKQCQHDDGMPERCAKGGSGVCKQPGYACQKDGLCHPGKK